MNVKIGIGCGKISILFVGGQFDRIEYLCSRESLSLAFNCESYAQAGDAIISKEAYEYVREKPNKVLDPQNGRLDSSAACLRLNGEHHERILKKTKKQPNYIMQDFLRSFISGAVWKHLMTRLKPSHGEQRVVTVLFVNLDFGRIQIENGLFALNLV